MISTRWTSCLAALLSLSLVAGVACKKDATREDESPTEQGDAPTSQPAEEAAGETEEKPEEEVAEPPAPTVDHAAFDGMLKAHVDPATGMVNYDGFKEKSAELDAYLDSTIATTDLSKLSADQQFAFYINAYNAYTIKLILENYPGVKSIRDIAENPWKIERWNVAGETLSLDQIEHEKLRPVFKDPRIHFAVNCASIGCPPLRAEAFVADRLEEQLEAATKQSLMQPKYAQVKKGTLHLSSLLDWYGKDFTDPEFKGHAESVAQYVARYGDEAVVKLVEEKGAKTPVKFMDYDWNLNKQ